MPKKEIAVKHSIIIFAYLFIVWGLYRFLIKLPEEVEEFFIKPILWLVPVFYLVRKEGKGVGSLGITLKRLFPAIYAALILGVIFAIEGVFINYLKYDQISFGANIGTNFILVGLALSLATSISEEITFRGFIFNRLWHALDNEWIANLWTTLMWVLVRLPITIFWWNFSLPSIIGYLILTSLFSMGSGFLFARTRNVSSSILLHVLWEWPIILFR